VPTAEDAGRLSGIVTLDNVAQYLASLVRLTTSGPSRTIEASPCFAAVAILRATMKALRTTIECSRLPLRHTELPLHNHYVHERHHARPIPHIDDTNRQTLIDPCSRSINGGLHARYTVNRAAGGARR
jgi:hypothetical protein